MGATTRLRKPRTTFSLGMHIDVERLVSRAAQRVKLSRNAFINDAAEEKARATLGLLKREDPQEPPQLARTG